MSRAHFTVGIALLLVVTACGSTDEGSGPEPLQPTAPAEAEFTASEFLPTVSRSFSAVVADFNGDGNDDIQLSRHRSRRGAPDDIDGIWLWTEDGYRLTHQFLDFKDRHGCAAGDIDGDGLMDLHCVIGGAAGGSHAEDDESPPSKRNETWIQQDDGTFVDEAETWGAHDPFGRGRFPMLFDFDQDGLLDLYVTNVGGRSDDERSENVLFRNDGSTFVEVQSELTGNLGDRCLNAVDWTGDGLPDVMVCSKVGEPSFFENLGNGRFADVTAQAIGERPRGWKHALVADLNGDGLLDLVAAKGGNVELRLNTGGAGWWADIDRLVKEDDDVVWLALGDFVGDDSVDIYAARRSPGCTDIDNPGSNAKDLVFVGPEFTAVEVPSPQTGCADAAYTVDGSVVLVLNGAAVSRGPVQLHDLSGLAPAG